ncbi:MAG: hypothetical protein A2W11_11315 [Ignavibacteria bacterium RBG_16_35_7]|nr:MAG: hypothetical protein A2W11_11315 [Ignavibacteria bacterium RBG_16_35_7]
MLTSGIKIFLVIIFVILLFKDNPCFNRVITNERNIFYSVSDTTRGKEEKTTKTRVPKDKEEKESSYENSAEDDFWGNCFSTCLFNFFFGNGETEEEKTKDEIIEEDTIKEGEKKNIVVKEIKTEEDTGAAYGGFIGLNLNGDGFFGDIADEYKDPGVLLGIDGFAFYKKFALNLGVTFGYNYCEPQFNYVSNSSQGIKIVDIPGKSEIDLTSFNFGINYIITNYKTLDDFGFLIGAGINYIKINEETELVRETYQQDTLISSVNTIEKINRSVVSPIISCTLIGSFSPKFWFNVNISYTFLNIDPQKKLSTPLDWNKVNGQLKIGFGIWYKIF